MKNKDSAVKREINRKLAEKQIQIITSKRIKEVKPDCVILDDDREIACDVAVWATGAEPQPLNSRTDLDIMRGYFRVNDYMQSTSFPNIFAGGDCANMESYADKSFPPKAGVYAVRAGPIIANNLIHAIKGEPLEPYVPQREFLALLMTGDEKAIGTKFGVAFTGDWVWKMKDWIDVSFMNLFDPQFLFKDWAS